MTGRINWNPGKSRNAADKTTAGLKDFQRQLRDSGGDFETINGSSAHPSLSSARKAEPRQAAAAGALTVSYRCHAGKNHQDEDE